LHSPQRREEKSASALPVITSPTKGNTSVSEEDLWLVVDTKEEL
jgi:hypothetical protein